MDLYTAAQTRELDRIAIEELGIPGFTLMSRAGRAAFEVLQEQWPDQGPLHIFCGPGNNGGDGSIVAALAAARRIPVHLYQLGDTAKITGDALTARQRAEQAGVTAQPWRGEINLDEGIIIDAMLGTGLGGDVREPYVGAIQHINHSGLPVLALDIPSGLCADTGRVLGGAVRAERTITFIGCKQGLLTGAGPDLSGLINYTDLEVPLEAFEKLPCQARMLELDECLAALPSRPLHAHKGLFGSVLVLGGDHGMGGAALMAAEAAGRCGAGLVSVGTRGEHVAGILARRPEVMCHNLGAMADARQLVASATVVAVGPGLGQNPWGEQLLYAAAESDKPLVVDADALNLLAGGKLVSPGRRDNWILTPHPGEAARLLGTDTKTVQSDRFAAVRELQARFGGVVLLKGSGTLIASDEQTIDVSCYGNPGMASGGMGDVLSGVLAGLLAQGLTPLEATRLGVCLHGAAADLAAEAGERGLLATDLMPHLQELLA